MAKTATDIKITAGKLLVSEPSLHDQYFAKSVVLLAEHNDEGSFGLVINHPSDLLMDQITDDLPGFNPRLFLGGPVKLDTLFYIHTKGELIEGSLPIINGLYWGGKADIVKKLILSGKITNNDIRFFIGYSGWSANQLEREMKENSWLLMDTTLNQVLYSNPRQLWRQLILNSGEDHAQWINYPEQPEWN
jgi:putative transcriptional regulator